MPISSSSENYNGWCCTTTSGCPLGQPGCTSYSRAIRVVASQPCARQHLHLLGKKETSRHLGSLQGQMAHRKQHQTLPADTVRAQPHDTAACGKQQLPGRQGSYSVLRGSLMVPFQLCFQATMARPAGETYLFETASPCTWHEAQHGGSYDNSYILSSQACSPGSRCLRSLVLGTWHIVCP